MLAPRTGGNAHFLFSSGTEERLLSVRGRRKDYMEEYKALILHKTDPDNFSRVC